MKGIADWQLPIANLKVGAVGLNEIGNWQLAIGNGRYLWIHYLRTFASASVGC